MLFATINLYGINSAQFIVQNDHEGSNVWFCVVKILKCKVCS